MADMDKVQSVMAIVGAVSSLFTGLHMLFPNVPLFQRVGMALRKFGS